MGNTRTEESIQSILNTSSDETVAPRTLVVGVMKYDGTSYVREAINPIESYMPVDVDEADATNQYYGFMRIDGSYYIMKKTVSGSAFSIRFYAASTNYSTDWTNRASLSYSLPTTFA